jgi:hypothetical protein
MIANKTNNVTQRAPPNWHIVHCNHKIQNHVLTGAHYWIHISPAYHCKKVVVLCANNIFFNVTMLKLCLLWFLQQFVC